MSQKKPDYGSLPFKATRVPSQAPIQQQQVPQQPSPTQADKQSKTTEKASSHSPKGLSEAEQQLAALAITWISEANSKPSLGAQVWDLPSGVVWKTAPIQQIFDPASNLLPFLLQKCGMDLNKQGFSCFIEGKVFGQEFKDFSIQLIGVLEDRLPDDFDALNATGEFVIAGTDQTRRLWQVWLQNIKHKQTPAYIESIWLDRKIWITSIQGIEKALVDYPAFETINHLALLSKGLLLFRRAKVDTAKVIGRPRGSGWFASHDDFEIAFREVLRNFSKEPTQLAIIKQLNKHPLCRSTVSADNGTHTETLRDWITNAGLREPQESNYQATKRIWSEEKTRKNPSGN